MSTVLVTGASGFIGSHLARALVRRGDAVWGLDRVPVPRPLDGASFVICDLLDARELRTVIARVEPEVVVHLAARTDMDERADLHVGYAANIGGVENLLAAIAGAGTVRRTIWASSQAVCRIGHVPSHDEEFDPNTVYGRSKVFTEQTVRRLDGGGTEWCIVRPTTVWGPHMNLEYLRFFRMLRNGRYFHVRREPIHKTYGYISNVVHQLARLCAAPVVDVHRQVFYVADYEPVILQEWAEGFQRELDGPPIRTIPYSVAKVVARSGDLLNRLGAHQFPFNSVRLHNVCTPIRTNLANTRRVCGDLPVAVHDGIRETVNWVRQML